MDFLGGDLTRAGHRGTTVAECEAICAGSSQCRGYTYVLGKSWNWPKYDVSRPLANNPILPRTGQVLSQCEIGTPYIRHS